MTDAELKQTILAIHECWYTGDEGPFESTQTILEMHGLLCKLFEYAEITETRQDRNPGMEYFPPKERK